MWQSYQRVIKNHLLNQLFANHPKNYRKARASLRSQKTIAARLIRELYRKLTPEVLTSYQSNLDILKQVITQQRKDKNKI